MEEIYYYNSPLGVIEFKCDEDALIGLDFIDYNNISTINLNSNSDFMKKCINQLDEYFNGTRKDFDINIKTTGTEFQRRVWKELMKIPYGSTASYKYIAEAAGSPKAVRAVGSANSKNKIAIIIPCHRIIGSNNSLTGYAGGLWRKEWLLKHETMI